MKIKNEKDLVMFSFHFPFYHMHVFLLIKNILEFNSALDKRLRVVIYSMWMLQPISLQSYLTNQMSVVIFYTLIGTQIHI